MAAVSTERFRLVCPITGAYPGLHDLREALERAAIYAANGGESLTVVDVQARRRRTRVYQVDPDGRSRRIDPDRVPVEPAAPSWADIVGVSAGEAGELMEVGR